MDLLEKINNNNITVGIIGLGYVGLPLVREFSKNSIRVIGFDIDPQKINLLNQGKSYISHIKDDIIKNSLGKGFKATTDFQDLKLLLFYQLRNQALKN